MTAVTAYLDYNATAPVRPEVAAAMGEALMRVGNPSSVHGAGRAARSAVEEARAKLAALVNARSENVVFTSGGTEANTLALTGGAAANGATHLLVSGIEHDSVLASAAASTLSTERLPVTADGLLDLAHLEERLGALKDEGAKPLVALMLANNETGVIQPVAEAARLVHDAGGLLLTDAVQGPGKIDVDIAALGAGMMTLSAHKFGGPQGVGALVLRDGVLLAPAMRGGGQEQGRRSGTENVAGIVGFGAVAALVLEEGLNTERLAALRDGLEARVREIAPEAQIFGAGAARLPNTSCFAVKGLKAETQVMALDLGGVAVSAGSACSSGKVTTSHVLTAMGVSPEIASSAIRVSLGWATEEKDIDRFAEVWRAHYLRVTGKTGAPRAPQTASTEHLAMEI